VYKEPHEETFLDCTTALISIRYYVCKIPGMLPKDQEINKGVGNDHKTISGNTL
jgi:hypothetical protein